jgi:Terminase large subunit, T4likevirus-type, N-terminal
MTKAEFCARLGALEALVHQPTQTPPDAVQLLRQAGMEPDPWQWQVLTSDAARILLNCSRQSGKTIVSAALALSMAMRDAGSLVLVLSPSLRQSQESFRKVLDLYHPWASSMPSSAESALRLELVNHSRIVSLPGREATVRGYSNVALLIVDEAARVPDELFYSVQPMLAVSAGRLVCLSTPFGKRGFFYDAWTSGAPWERVELPATACPRIPLDFLEQERRSLPPLFFRSEYCCEFVDTLDQVFPTDLLMGAITDAVTPLWAEEEGWLSTS